MSRVFIVLLALMVSIQLHAIVSDGYNGQRISSSSSSSSSSVVVPKIFVFFSIPQSLAHQQISVALELYQRGHHVLFATLEGFTQMLDKQLAVFLKIHSDVKQNQLEVLEIQSKQEGGAFGEAIRHLTQTRPEERQFDGHKMAMSTYGQLFLTIINGIDRIKNKHSSQAEKDDDKRKQELIFSKTALMIIPGPWSSLIRYFHKNNLNYIFMLPSPVLLHVFSSPLETWQGGQSHRQGARSVVERVHILWTAARYSSSSSSSSDTFDTQLLKQSPPVLRLVQSIPSLAGLRSYSPLTVFTGPAVSLERRDPRHLSTSVLALLNNEKRLPLIYISMGSIAQLSAKQIEKLSQAFFPADKKWVVVWALSKEQQLTMSSETAVVVKRFGPEYVVIDDWVETPSILEHPTTTLFVSHCGANSLNEGLVSGTPILGLPLFGDQPKNCFLAEKKLQMAICRSLYETSAQELRDTTYAVVLNRSHPIHEFAKRAKILTTRGYRPGVTAADWIEIASELQGDFSLLATPEDYETIVQLYCLDVVAVLTVLLAFVCWRFGITRGRGTRPGVEKNKVQTDQEARKKDA